MDWSYVAGYFDGEGSVCHHANGRGRKTTGLAWYNSHRKSLEMIRDFMSAGHLRERPIRSHQKAPVCVLTVSRRSDLLRVLDEMIPHLIVKREAAERLREYVQTSVRDESPGFGKIVAVPTEQLAQWYHGEGKSYADIGRLVGVSPGAVARVFRKRGLLPRPVGSAYLKGVAKSEATRRRMKESRRRMWQDPAFREQQLANLARGRRARAANA